MEQAVLWTVSIFAWLIIGYLMLVFVWKDIGSTIHLLSGDKAHVAAWGLIVVSIIFWPCPHAIIWLAFLCDTLNTAGVKTYWKVRRAVSYAAWDLRHVKGSDHMARMFIKELDKAGNVVVKYPTKDDVIDAATELAIPLEVVDQLRTRWFNEVNKKEEK